MPEEQDPELLLCKGTDPRNCDEDADGRIIGSTGRIGAVGCIDNRRKTCYGYDQRIELFGSNGCVMTDHVKNTHIIAVRRKRAIS